MIALEYYEYEVKFKAGDLAPTDFREVDFTRSIVDTLARCVSHSHIPDTNGSKPQIGNASVAHAAAQTEPGEHR